MSGGFPDGTVWAVPHGDGTNSCTSNVAPPLVGEVFPEALPRNVGDHTSYPAAHDYVECDAGEPTHLTVSWTIVVNGTVTGHGPELGLVTKGTHNWDMALGEADKIWIREGNGQIRADDEPSDELYGLPAGSVRKAVTYYKAVDPDGVKPGHDKALLEITPEPGYYVTDVVITCGYQGNGYVHCSVYNTGHAFRTHFGIDGSEKVSLLLDSESFCHGSAAGGALSRYWIMIRTEKIADELYVEYDPGEIAGAGGLDPSVGFGRDDDWLSGTVRGNSVTTRLTKISDLIGEPETGWTADDLAYTVDSISPDVLAACESSGWSFAGWQLEYYTEAENDEGEIVFESDKWNEFAVDPAETVKLKMHARLVAQWEKVPAEDDVSGGFELPDTGGSGTFGYHMGGMAVLCAGGCVLAGRRRKAGSRAE